MAVILTDKTGNESAMAISFCREKRQGNRMWEKEGLRESLCKQMLKSPGNAHNRRGLTGFDGNLNVGLQHFLVRRPQAYGKFKSISLAH